jgi:hypothetical protein
MNYKEFLESKIVVAEDFGTDVSHEQLTECLLPHQKDIVQWCLKGGRRAIFASFGLGKTVMQLEVAKQTILHTGKPFLICMPLGVVGEFKRDNEFLNTGFDIQYITDTDGIENYDNKIYLTNYERVRKGDIDPSKFGGVSFDEASILRSLKTETTNFVLKYFKKVPFRYVATATPTPNDFIEILNYADYLGVIDRGHALTRFFQRDSVNAGNLKLYENKKEEFWKWVSTWAVFINKPSDLGYDDTGYILPKMHLHEIEVQNDAEGEIKNKRGDIVLFKDTTKSLTDTGREKRDSIDLRVEKTLQIINQLIIGYDEKTSDLLSTKPGEGDKKIVGILPGEQTQDRQRGEESLHDGVSENISAKETHSGGESRKESQKTGDVRNESSVQRESETNFESSTRKESGNEVEQSTEEIQNERRGVSGDVGASGLWLRYLRYTGFYERAEKALCGSLSSDGEGEGNTLSALQLRIRALQGQYTKFIQSGRILEQIVIFCDLNDEQALIEKSLQKAGITVASIYGGQSLEEKELLIKGWKEGKYTVILSKKKILGSGVNLQQACKMIYAGIDYKFNDFIQGLHRIFRFGQAYETDVFIIHTNNEQEVLKTLKEKWRKHIELQTEMINLVREYGLNSDKIKSDMKRQIFTNERSAQIAGATVYNNDTVITHERMPDNSTDMILTSIPFGDHYEYSDNYNDFGHNHGNGNFFNQMDYLTPHLLRTLKPGRVAAIHVKDRIRYSYQNGTSFTTISDFSGQTVAHFEKHGFYLTGKITVTTDVVRENNQTYRLGWSEQCKDASKMGVGMPEYILLFRKRPTESNNAYADHPVTKTKLEYTRANWQLDAHAYWKSNGNRFLSSEELKSMDMDKLCRFWKSYNLTQIYDFKEHLAICEELESHNRLSALFMTLPTHSSNDDVWTDINRMNTLNANQVNRKKEKHICPLQLDIIERLINRFTNPGEIVDDPFGGLFSTAYKAIQMERKAISTELNPEYYNDGLYYLKSIEYKVNVPTLFDLELTA